MSDAVCLSFFFFLRARLREGSSHARGRIYRSFWRAREEKQVSVVTPSGGTTVLPVSLLLRTGLDLGVWASGAGRNGFTA